MPQIYKITYPNGKIYIGSDMTDTLHYFGSVNSRMIEADFNEEERRTFTITKTILWSSVSATRSALVKLERQYILAYRANDPGIGYNQWPKVASKNPTPLMIEAQHQRPADQMPAVHQDE